MRKHPLPPASRILLLILIALACALVAAAQSNNTTIQVTTLADRGPGSLREALKQGHRRIEFKTGGIIRLDRMIEVTASDVEIDGSTAPRPGITIAGATFALDGARNITLRHLRFRQAKDDNLRITGACRNILIENCSSTHGGDGAIDITEDYKTKKRPDGVTIRRCLIAATEKAMLVVAAENLTLEQNLFTNNGQRSPQLHNAQNFNLVNNVIRNFSVYGVRVRAGSTGNVVGNLIPSSPLIPKRADRTFIIDTSGKAPRIHTRDNIGPAQRDPNTLGTANRPVGRLPNNLLPADRVERTVIAEAGARPLDRIDAALIRNNPKIPHRPSKTKDKQ